MNGEALTRANDTIAYWRWLSQVCTAPRAGARRVVARFRFPQSWHSRTGRTVYYLTDAELPEFLAREEHSSCEWGARTTVRVDGQHRATLGDVPEHTRRARRARMSR
jgi:hypothetical protein